MKLLAMYFFCALMSLSISYYIYLVVKYCAYKMYTIKYRKSKLIESANDKLENILNLDYSDEERKSLEDQGFFEKIKEISKDLNS